MKKIITPVILFTSIILLTSCTLPWEKSETETIVVDSSNPELPANTESQPAPSVDITPSDTPKAIAEGGVYLPYTSTAVAQAKGQVVLFFWASWSPASIGIDKDITANIASLEKDTTVLKVNYDDAKELIDLYGITEQPSFVQVDNSGKMIKKWRGGETLTEIIGQIQK